MKYPKHKSFLKSFATLLLLLLLVLGINIGYKQYNKNKRLNNPHESEVTMSTGVNNKVLDKESNNDDNLKKEDFNNETDNNKETIENNKYTSYNQLRKLTATSIVDDNKLDHTNLSSYFETEEISDEIYNRIYGYSFKEDAQIDLTELRYVRVLYYGFDNKTHVGELIVNKEIATDICNIMYELYKAKYPIERMELIDDYKADDEASMAANNSSAFNYRTISGTNKLSNHSKGLAIDINPLYNPYVKTVDGKEIISPTQGVLYADRSVDLPYLITKNDICYKTFLKYGFTWGGDWNSCKDYQHFEKILINRT